MSLIAYSKKNQIRRVWGGLQRRINGTEVMKAVTMVMKWGREDREKK